MNTYFILPCIDTIRKERLKHSVSIPREFYSSLDINASEEKNRGNCIWASLL